MKSAGQFVIQFLIFIRTSQVEKIKIACLFIIKTNTLGVLQNVPGEFTIKHVRLGFGIKTDWSPVLLIHKCVSVVNTRC